jgi:hypothetical protein
MKVETNCDNKHPRVAIARFYLEEVGELARTSRHYAGLVAA